MNLDEILRWRIGRQFLGRTRGTDVVAVARRVGGLHAQVTASAHAAARLRLPDPPDLDAALYADRTLVRTWAARGTLHLLPAADLPRWVAAMSTRNRETKGSWLKYHGVTAAQMRDIVAAVPDVLGGTPMTREELAEGLIAGTGHDDLRGPLTQGFGAILKPLAFRGLLCSGPPRGRNVTFVAPRAWFGDWEPVPVDAAIDELALAYLGAYGPADPAEFARWFDLTPSLAKKSFARLADRLTPAGDGFVPADLAGDGDRTDTVHLLPAFDPYVVASTRQLDRISSGPKSAVSRPQGWISPTLVVNGRIEGVWEDVDGRAEVRPFGRLAAGVRRALPDHAVVV
ncbi:winged helix DNA-binding domain-containing protein [Jidongwangia harbinensis]|uniref:winged helix DNA-binding domain-containing protein n=1 Tax=Jidongwangia harbinensis TaxID=2878561 RepID=UPI001CD9CFAA|nr:winged helix DNA-binding domain-containing protein [Jidongwangia harbinensis]MCA2218491.1 winged helix DNA-binding domain-containing protein [Jidongwangia harbinensis]